MILCKFFAAQGECAKGGEIVPFPQEATFSITRRQVIRQGGKDHTLGMDQRRARAKGKECKFYNDFKAALGKKPLACSR